MSFGRILPRREIDSMCLDGFDRTYGGNDLSLEPFSQFVH